MASLKLHSSTIQAYRVHIFKINTEKILILECTSCYTVKSTIIESAVYKVEVWGQPEDFLVECWENFEKFWRDIKVKISNLTRDWLNDPESWSKRKKQWRSVCQKRKHISRPTVVTCGESGSSQLLQTLIMFSSLWPTSRVI